MQDRRRVRPQLAGAILNLVAAVAAVIGIVVLPISMGMSMEPGASMGMTHAVSSGKGEGAESPAAMGHSADSMAMDAMSAHRAPPTGEAPDSDPGAAADDDADSGQCTGSGCGDSVMVCALATMCIVGVVLLIIALRMLRRTAILLPRAGLWHRATPFVPNPSPGHARAPSITDLCISRT
ncbi:MULTISPECIES: hypothetical protein [unclassified Brevibacterium]|uniref:hypothetical protein n=1 Tax=unclassified Brevibacterium TaxID=2614124 RepID=UPI0010F82440|nr:MULTISPECIES: hypothetical protein [unclassified Brevibacterium]MCM1011830.1 hypothetical protein [Brevibacterium sp. XM4083]